MFSVGAVLTLMESSPWHEISMAMYPDLSTFDHELGSANSACWIDEKIGDSELSFK